MEVLTIEHSAFQQLISKIDTMDEFIRKAKLEQQSSLDDDWVDGQAVSNISASATKPCNAYAVPEKPLTAPSTIRPSISNRRTAKVQ
jgi:hypothetical protein